MRFNFISFLFIAFISGGLQPNVSAQNKLVDINDGTTPQALKRFYADTLLIHCDTIYVLNKVTFKLYNDEYIKAKNKDEKTNRLITNYENMIQVQIDMLNTKERFYQELKSKFDSLAGNATIFIDKSSTNISQISTSLGRASDNLVETQKLLSDSQKLLEEERRNSWKRTFKIGVGGFSFGVAVTALIFLIKK